MAKLSQQHFRPSLARGCCGCIPSPLFVMATRKNNKSIERLQHKREKAKKHDTLTWLAFLFFLSLP